jgi:DNA-binding transcriptional LysR family regulator
MTTISGFAHSLPAPLTLRADPLACSFATTYAGVIAFIAVVAEGSFTRAADRLGIGRSSVSRSIRKLEEQLSVRLFLRNTRNITLTREGDLFHAGCHGGVDRIIQAVEEVRDLREGPPRGHLCIGSPVGFGRRVVAPLLSEFQAAYPEISVELLLRDEPADLVSDRVDIAFRNGHMEDAGIIAKQIVPMRMLVCASRDYQWKHGLPATVEDLAHHQCINFRHSSGRIVEWELEVDGRPRKILPSSKLACNDPDLVLQAVLDGYGIAQMPCYLVRDFILTGALLPCLQQHAPRDSAHYICFLGREYLPSRKRVFIDFMTAKIRADWSEFRNVS